MPVVPPVLEDNSELVTTLAFLTKHYSHRVVHPHRTIRLHSTFPHHDPQPIHFHFQRVQSHLVGQLGKFPRCDGVIDDLFPMFRVILNRGDLHHHFPFALFHERMKRDRYFHLSLFERVEEVLPCH